MLGWYCRTPEKTKKVGARRWSNTLMAIAEREDVGKKEGRKEGWMRQGRPSSSTPRFRSCFCFHISQFFHPWKSLSWNSFEVLLLPSIQQINWEVERDSAQCIVHSAHVQSCWANQQFLANSICYCCSYPVAVHLWLSLAITGSHRCANPFQIPRLLENYNHTESERERDR